MGRTPCCDVKRDLKKGPWTPQEDKKLFAYVQHHGHGNWRSLPAKAGLQRCGKSCRLRWINYLKPDIKRGNFSVEEDRTIIQLHALLGNKWSVIAAHLYKRTDNEVKNYWNSHLKKRLIRMGIDPITHKPKDSTIGQYSKDTAATMSHMAQWESARLQAEARESILQQQLGSSSNPTKLIISKIPPQPSPPPCLDVLKAWQQSLIASSSSLLDSASTKHNNTTMYNMYAITLATDHHDDLHSPASTLSFPETNKQVLIAASTTTTPAGGAQLDKRSLSFDENDGDNVDPISSDKMMGEDDDIMVAVEAFRAARRCSDEINTYSELPNASIEGLNNNDIPIFESFEEYGYGNFNLEANFEHWNSSLLNQKH